ncbi:MAG: pantoate--beta-alanine ligase [Limnochordales bacterium]|nr:pantoate--beta-alanine ligase [Limnochordales bacterium]
MQLVKTIAELRKSLAPFRRRGARIGFVPTMGYLHEGHASLIRQARRENDVVVVSDFVNPTQFGPNEDYARYPRDLARDQAVAASAGADFIFAPSVEEMYPDGDSQFFVEVGSLSEVLCGRSRPGHFRGVATVVTKLFHIVQPDAAYFGQKDYQQALILRRMVHELFFPLRLVVCPTVREEDGLAMSSRNTYLSPTERQEATVLYQALQQAARLLREGERDAGRLRQAMLAVIGRAPSSRVDYVEIVDPLTLQPVPRCDKTTLFALAVFIGTTRLIDNALLNPDGSERSASDLFDMSWPTLPS